MSPVRASVTVTGPSWAVTAPAFTGVPGERSAAAGTLIDRPPAGGPPGSTVEVVEVVDEVVEDVVDEVVEEVVVGRTVEVVVTNSVVVVGSVVGMVVSCAVATPPDATAADTSVPVTTSSFIAVRASICPQSATDPTGSVRRPSG
jgi:hypothetical protein